MTWRTVGIFLFVFALVAAVLPAIGLGLGVAIGMALLVTGIPPLGFAIVVVAVIAALVAFVVVRSVKRKEAGQ